MVEIGLEARVQAGDDRNAKRLGESLGAGAEDVGGGDVDDVGAEGANVLAKFAVEAERKPEFAALGQSDRRNRHQRPCGLERGGVSHRRIDPILMSARFKVADEAVQRLVRTLSDVIVIAREKRDPHRPRPCGS